jgi:ABC-type phosphate transport system auxiliary subunit
MSTSAEQVKSLRAQADALEKLSAAEEKMIKAKEGKDPKKLKELKDEVRALRAAYRKDRVVNVAPGDAVAMPGTVEG